jgi:hypothetical protein
MNIKIQNNELFQIFFTFSNSSTFPFKSLNQCLFSIDLLFLCVKLLFLFRVHFLNTLKPVYNEEVSAA